MFSALNSIIFEKLTNEYFKRNYNGINSVLTSVLKSVPSKYSLALVFDVALEK